MSVSPSAIPCRLCHAAPNVPCKYKGTPIVGSLGGHKRRTPKKYRCFHARRVADAALVVTREQS